MYRTHFHRQLAALYDAGRRQAIATEEIADNTQIDEGGDVDNVLKNLSSTAMRVMAHTIRCCAVFAQPSDLASAVLNARNANNHAQLLDALNGRLKNANDDDAYASVLQALQDQSAIGEEFKSLFLPFNDGTAETLSIALGFRMRDMLRFLLHVAREVKDPPSQVAPQQAPTAPAKTGTTRRSKPMSKATK